MTTMQTISEGFWRWLDRVAEAMVALAARLAAPRTISLVEGDSGEFTAQSSDISLPAAANECRLRIEEPTVFVVMNYLLDPIDCCRQYRRQHRRRSAAADRPECRWC